MLIITPIHHSLGIYQRNYTDYHTFIFITHTELETKAKKDPKIEKYKIIIMNIDGDQSCKII